MALAEFAGETIAEASRTNRRILGREPRKTIYVDGREGAPLQSVRPDGQVVAEFDVVDWTAVTWINEQLRLHSPVSRGPDPDPSLEYIDSHKLYVDGREVAVSDVRSLASARVLRFVNTTPYATKIETGASSQAPHGVYQVVAVLGQRKFPLHRVRFEFHRIAGYVAPSIVLEIGAG